jgi:hypothetical protein
MYSDTVTVHAVKAYEGSGGIAALIFGVLSGAERM